MDGEGCRQSLVRSLAAQKRLYAWALMRMSAVDFEQEMATWSQLEAAERPWLDGLNERELVVLALTGDRSLLEAMVQARPDG